MTDTNLECASYGITLQAMDSSHVALVALSLKNDGFDMYRCDRNISLGMNLVSCSTVISFDVPSFSRVAVGRVVFCL